MLGGFLAVSSGYFQLDMEPRILQWHCTYTYIAHV